MVESRLSRHQRCFPSHSSSLISLTFFTVVYLTTEAAKSNTCRTNAATIPTIPGLPGKDGRPGHNGTDGEQGPPEVILTT